MWRSFFLAVGAYCCLLGVEALAVEKAVVKVSPTDSQRRPRSHPARLGTLEPAGHGCRGSALFFLDPATRGQRLIKRRPVNYPSPAFLEFSHRTAYHR